MSAGECGVDGNNKYKSILKNHPRLPATVAREEGKQANLPVGSKLRSAKKKNITETTVYRNDGALNIISKADTHPTGCLAANQRSLRNRRPGRQENGSLLEPADGPCDDRCSHRLMCDKQGTVKSLINACSYSPERGCGGKVFDGSNPR